MAFFAYVHNVEMPMNKLLDLAAERERGRESSVHDITQTQIPVPMYSHDIYIVE
jgi:hypothetical protein